MAVFPPKFINLPYKVDWTDSAKILALEKGLHRDVKHRLIFKSHSNILTSYNTFIEIIKDIDYQLCKNNTNYYRNGGNNNRNGRRQGNNNNGIGSGNTTLLVILIVTHTFPVTVVEPVDLSAAVVWNSSQGGQLCPKTPAKKLAKHKYCIANNFACTANYPATRFLSVLSSFPIVLPQHLMLVLLVTLLPVLLVQKKLNLWWKLPSKTSLIKEGNKKEI